MPCSTNTVTRPLPVPRSPVGALELGAGLYAAGYACTGGGACGGFGVLDDGELSDAEPWPATHPPESAATRPRQPRTPHRLGPPRWDGTVVSEAAPWEALWEAANNFPTRCAPTVAHIPSGRRTAVPGAMVRTPPKRPAWACADMTSGVHRQHFPNNRHTAAASALWPPEVPYWHSLSTSLMVRCTASACSTREAMSTARGALSGWRRSMIALRAYLTNGVGNGAAPSTFPSARSSPSTVWGMGCSVLAQ